MQHKRRFLVIGCGSIGKRHIGNLIMLNEKDIVAFDTRADRRQEVKSRFGVEVLNNVADAWSSHPDVAVITAPTSMHVSLATQAADLGCHMFIEKPLSHNRDGLENLLAVVRSKNLITLVGSNMRFHPGLKQIKKMLDDRAIGRIVAMRVEFGQYLPDWHSQEDYRQGYSARAELGGGVILDAIHEFDYIRWMLGEIDTVACISGKLSDLEINTEDTAAILLRFSSGAIGEIHLDYVQRAYSRTCHIIGEDGTIRWDYKTGEIAWYSAESRDWKSYHNPPDWEPNHMYLDELRHFLRCRNGEEEPCLDVFQAAQVLRVALAAKESAKTERFMNVG
ncbi:MAG: Gfo/Idh/MocA family oxidoreductase [Deltaproteobacteria bacterium]|nr:Gfo/Idh/MocA family oxidoreductase [Deltaproteobacteria bacterium]